MKVDVRKEKSGNVDVDSLWSALTDFAKENEYWSNIRNIKVLEEGDNTIRREATVGPMGFGMKTTQTLEFVLGKSFVVKIDGDQVKGHRDIVIKPNGNGVTTVQVSWELEVKDAPGFVQDIITKQLCKSTERALERIFSDAAL